MSAFDKLLNVFSLAPSRALFLFRSSALGVLLFTAGSIGLSGQTTELAAIQNLIHQGKLSEAEQKLQAYLRLHPHSAKANTLLGTAYLKQGQLQQAVRVLQEATAAAPSSMEARLALGDAYLAGGKLEDALAAYQAGAKIAPHEVRLNIALAKLYLAQGQFSKSLESAESIPAGKRTAELLPTLAADYFGLQQPEKAGLEIRAMIEIADKQPDLIPELAEFFVAHRDFKSSEQLLNLAKTKQPGTDRFLIVVAQTQAGLGQLNDAQNTLEGVLERKPDSVEALTAAGVVASQQQNWEAASEAFSRANDLAPDRPDILYGLATAELHSNQAQRAAVHAQKLQEIVPDDLRATYVLALALFGVKKKEDAKRYAEQVLAVHPDDREMNLVMADIALNDERNLASAKAHVKNCFKLNSQDPAAFYYQGMILKMEGDIPGAIQNLARSLAGNSQSADAQAALGSLCLQSGDLTCALPALEKATQLAPEESQYHYQLALAYARIGSSDKAKEQLAVYQQMKAKELKDAKDSKGPATSEVPPMGIGSRP